MRILLRRVSYFFLFYRPLMTSEVSTRAKQTKRRTCSVNASLSVRFILVLASLSLICGFQLLQIEVEVAVELHSGLQVQIQVLPWRLPVDS